MPPKKQAAPDLAPSKAAVEAAQAVIAAAAAAAAAAPGPASAAAASRALRRSTRNGGKSQEGDLAEADDSSLAQPDDTVVATEASVRDWWELVTTPMLHAWLKAHQAEGVKPGPNTISRANRANREFMLDRMVKSGVRLPRQGKEEEELLAAWRIANKFKGDERPKEGAFLSPRQPVIAAGAGGRSSEEKYSSHSSSSQMPSGLPTQQPKYSSDHGSAPGVQQQHQLQALPEAGLMSSSAAAQLQHAQANATSATTQHAYGQTHHSSAPDSASFAPHAPSPTQGQRSDAAGHPTSHTQPHPQQHPSSHSLHHTAAGASSHQESARPRPRQCLCCGYPTGPVSEFPVPWRCPVPECQLHGHLPPDSLINRRLFAQLMAESQGPTAPAALTGSSGSSSASSHSAALNQSHHQQQQADAMSLAAAAAAAAEKVKRDRDSISQVDTYLQSITCKGPFMPMWTGAQAHQPLSHEQALLESRVEGYDSYMTEAPSEHLIAAVRANKLTFLALALPVGPNSPRPAMSSNGTPIVGPLSSLQQFCMVFAWLIGPALADMPRALQQWILLMRQVVMFEGRYGWPVAYKYVENVLNERIMQGSELGIGKLSAAALQLVHSNRRIDLSDSAAGAAAGSGGRGPAHSPSSGHTPISDQACHNWNKGTPCGSANGGPCGRQHACQLCRGGHKFTDCPQYRSDQHSRGHSSGGGGNSGNYQGDRDRRERGGRGGYRKSGGGGGHQGAGTGSDSNNNGGAAGGGNGRQH